MTRVRPTKRQALVATAAVAACAFLVVQLFAVVPEARVGWVWALGRAGSYEALVSRLEDPDTDTRGAASRALVGAGAAAAPALTRGLGRLGESGRGLAAAALGAIGPAARGALPELTAAALSDESESVREVAGLSVGRVARGDADAVAALLGLLDIGTAAERLCAARAFAGLDEDEQLLGVPALARALKHPDPRVREESAEALGRVGPPALAAVAALLDALADADPRVSREAGEALGDITEGAADAALRDRVTAAVAAAKAARRQPE